MTSDLQLLNAQAQASNTMTTVATADNDLLHAKVLEILSLFVKKK